ncbi:unnamed protein product [Urochloa decumbens]|uniref:Uncharacterized protein n=1 Tax=Urochloa decumbens TaxID=240449 RepID=A0ABC8ZAW8_9POAL
MELKVQRTSRSYVRPAADTPSGSLELSAIDLDVGLRHMVRSLHVFRPRPHHAGGQEEGDQHSSPSPARVIREALGKALVDYYPFAGRLVDGAGGPATARVECTGEGAWFVEAVAGCTLEDAAYLDRHPLAIPAEDLLPDAAPALPAAVKAQFHAATGRRCSTFDVAVAKVWQARTRSLRLPDTSAPVTLCIFANARHLLRKDGDDGATGFYGNCFFPATLAVEAGAVERADVAGVVGMVQDAKARLAEQFARWAAGEGVEKEDPYALWWRHEPLFVSDWRRLGFLEADYGWGAPLHVSPLAALLFMPVALLSAPPAPREGSNVACHGGL